MKSRTVIRRVVVLSPRNWKDVPPEKVKVIFEEITIAESALVCERRALKRAGVEGYDIEDVAVVMSYLEPC